MKTDTKKILVHVADQCTECGTCIEDCALLQAQENTYPGSIAEAVLSGLPDDHIQDLILTCSLCGLCHESCPEGLDIPQMIREIRSFFMDTGVSDPEDYRFLWVDHDWNGWTAYRNTYQFDNKYGDLFKDKCDVLFFPGCTLANEGPDLVHSAVNWLADQGDVVGLSLQCCGVPLIEMGLTDRAEKYKEKLWQSLKKCGASRIVTSCPTCHSEFLNSGKNSGIEICSLYQLMVDAGVTAPVIGSGKITIHDSCSDRKGEVGNNARVLLRDYDIIEMKHNRNETICCGSGGCVSMVDPEICMERAQRRLNEVADTGADVCVSCCMACTQRLSREDHRYNMRHILELIFNNLIDHEQYRGMVEAMWEGEWGDYNAWLFENSKILSF